MSGFDAFDLYEIKEAELSELADLMGDPPGGLNHGTTRKDGWWVPLDVESHGDGLVAFAESPYQMGTPRNHGTRYAYQIGCRCERCRAWNAEKSRRRRASVPTPISEE